MIFESQVVISSFNLQKSIHHILQNLQYINLLCLSISSASSVLFAFSNLSFTKDFGSLCSIFIEPKIKKNKFVITKIIDENIMNKSNRILFLQDIYPLELNLPKYLHQMNYR